MVNWVDDKSSPELLLEAIPALRAEADRQIEKWGNQVHTPFEWLTFTAEELGELAQAISGWYYGRGNTPDIRKEAIQVATLALKIADMCERPVPDAEGENSHAEH